ncbi:MAG TPA: response regulator, partial [Gracilimonas sp.]|uniref:response regulator n=1 Tax=Gracilimonas sp. TaxID=1974203 RepID=UPI002DA4DA01|nr:response regulator [Gracilimonas sp.]
MTAIQKDLKILVVEDNPGDFVLIEEYLSEGLKSPEVLNARTFHEAEEYLNNHIGFHIILLDLSLPDLSGEPLVQKMMDLSGQIPVIVLTGYE